MNAFQYDTDTIASLRVSISAPRLQTYARLVGTGSWNDTLDLYAMNAHLSGAFILPAQALEITLRNKIDVALSRAFGIDWLINGRVGFTSWQLREIKDAIAINGLAKVDSFHLGFWSQMFSRSNDHLWRTVLNRMFIQRPSIFTRANIFSLFDRLRIFRNRIAHHEQIISNDR